MATFKIKDPVTKQWVPQSITSDGVQPDWNQDNPIESDYIKNKPIIPPAYELPIASADTLGGVKVGENLTITEDGTLNAEAGGASTWEQVRNKPFSFIGSGLTVNESDELIADDGELIVEEDTLKRINGGGGVQSDWEETDPTSNAFIKNKPFESHIESVPGLPHTYVDNISLELSKNIVDEFVKEVGSKEWEMYIGVPSNKCFCSTGLILNYTQAKGCYSFTHEGAPYPGDEAIIEEYGSVQAFGEAMAAAIVEFVRTPAPCTYIGDFNYIPGNLPDIKLLNNPVFTSKILDNELQDVPYTLLVNNISPTPDEPMFTTNAIDVWGNLGGMYNGVILEVMYNYPSIVGSLAKAGISKPTSDNYYFAISTISYMGMYPIYWYDIAFADDKYFEKVSIPIPVTYTTQKTTEAGSAIIPSIDSNNNQVSHFELRSAPQYLAIIYKIEASNDVTTRFDMDNKSNGVLHDTKFKFILDGNVISSFDRESQDIYDMDDYRENLQISQGTHTVVIELSWEGLASWGIVPQYFDLIIFNSESSELTFTELPSAEVEIITYTYNSSFDYILESAEKEVIKQIQSKFIEKPVWWFGDKEVIISEPTHLITNAGMYFGGF